MKNTKLKIVAIVIVTSLLILPQYGIAADTQQKAVLVTGASTGIGRKITEKLAAEVHYVYAGARKPEDISRRSHQAGAGLSLRKSPIYCPRMYSNWPVVDEQGQARWNS